jgi:hypothetical protein
MLPFIPHFSFSTKRLTKHPHTENPYFTGIFAVSNTKTNKDLTKKLTNKPTNTLTNLETSKFKGFNNIITKRLTKKVT